VKVLLDTCTFLWIILDAPQLSTRARTLFSDPANEIFLGAASAWEMSVKFTLGRLPLPEPPERFIPEQRGLHKVSSLPLDEAAAVYEANLPPLHRDPFDRMLVCQAIVHDLVILTPDAEIRKYPRVRTEW
jgi:PIN domain nuclease of toxin-antitoxin system